MTTAEHDALTPDGGEETAGGGQSRVTLSFTPSGKSVRVPAGVTVFDAASWNGIAIDSTCGGHGTCKKCKVRVLGSPMPVQRLDRRALTQEQIDDGWRLACLATCTRDHEIDVPPLTTRPKAATVGVGRQVILRPAVQKRYIELAEPSLVDQRTDLQRVLDAVDDFELTVEPRVVANCSFRVVGRLDTAEAQRAEYGFLTPAARARASLL